MHHPIGNPPFLKSAHDQFGVRRIILYKQNNSWLTLKIFHIHSVE
jgi:hypothetical protein